MFPDHPSLRRLAALALFYAAYVAGGGLGQGMALIPGVAITFWPPAGLLVATLLLNRPGEWLWWVAAGCVAELTCNVLWFHNPAGRALLYFAGNAGEALLATAVIRRISGSGFALESRRDVVATALAACIGPLVSATTIATVDAAVGRHEFAVAWPLVWLGDATGLLVSMPLVFVAVRSWRERGQIAASRRQEAVVLAVATVVVAGLYIAGRLPTVYMMLPLMLWAAASFGFRGAAVSMGFVTLVVAASKAAMRGEFSNLPDGIREGSVMLQAFLGLTAIGVLVVAALARERQRALAALGTLNAELEARVEERTSRLRESEAELREIDRRKDQFLATLSHELRNPLAPMRNAVELLKRGRTDAERVDYARGVLDRQIQHMESLVGDLLDLARINADKLVLKCSRVELAELVAQAVESVRPQAQSRRQGLEVQLAPEELVLNADPARLAQALRNLLTNASKYTHEGGHIHVTSRREGGDAVVVVTDDGMGIENHMLERIFDTFTQLPAAVERADGGLGIGLALVRRLVDLHGGSVTAMSDGPGRGSSFCVRLPLNAAASATQPTL
jgi:signal transduction histidine kinase